MINASLPAHATHQTMNIAASVRSKSLGIGLNFFSSHVKNTVKGNIPNQKIFSKDGFSKPDVRNEDAISSRLKSKNHNFRLLGKRPVTFCISTKAVHQPCWLCDRQCQAITGELLSRDTKLERNPNRNRQNLSRKPVGMYG